MDEEISGIKVDRPGEGDEAFDVDKRWSTSLCGALVLEH
jgi:hypothetical protein